MVDERIRFAGFSKGELANFLRQESRAAGFEADDTLLGVKIAGDDLLHRVIEAALKGEVYGSSLTVTLTHEELAQQLRDRICAVARSLQETPVVGSRRRGYYGQGEIVSLSPFHTVPWHIGKLQAFSREGVSREEVKRWFLEHSKEGEPIPGYSPE